jgi:hypothetical protein
LNTFRRNIASLNYTTGQLSAAVVANPGKYGLTASEVSALTAKVSSWNTCQADAAAARANALAKTQAQVAQRKVMEDTISALAVKFYANPGLTDADIVAAGLEPRDTVRTRHEPKEPLNLLAHPKANGTVQLVWERNGNSMGTIFEIDQRTEQGHWQQVVSTTKRRITLSGYKPGEGMWFRVRATWNGTTSVPSNEAPIYHADEDSPLEVAA